MNLLSKTFKSALWMMARMAGRQLANAVLFFWLAAILDPGDLGIASLAVTLPVFLLPVVIRGIRDAVIQRPKLDESLLDTAFLVNVVYGVILTVLLVAFAPLSARLFGDPRMLQLSLVASVIPLLAALGNLQEALCERHFQHKRITLIYLVSALIAVILSIWSVFAGFEIWALVIFNVSSYGTTTLMLWLFSDWRPKGKWSRAEAWEQTRFAAPVVLSQTIANGNQRIVEMLIGVLLSPTAVAFFRFGSNFTRLLNQIIVTPVIQVLMPAFARSKADPETNLFRTLVLNSAVLFPVFMGAATVIPDFVVATFGEEWALGGWIGMILCYSVFASLIGPAAYPLLIVQGKGNWSAILSSASLVVSVVCVVIGAQFGTIGAAIGFVLRGLLTIPMTFYVLKHTLEMRPRRILASFMPFAVLSLAIHGLLLLPLFEGLPVCTQILLKLGVGSVLYLICLRLLLRQITPEQYRVLVNVLPGRLRRFL